MSACILVANAYRARVFTVDPWPDPTGDPRFVLTERKDLVNPASRLADEALFSTTQTGARGRPGHHPIRSARSDAFDDHREDHHEAWLRRFAESVVSAVAELEDVDRLKVVAGPRFLGTLRRATSALPETVEISEIPKDLTAMDPHALRLRLVEDGVIPESTVRP